MAKLFRIEDFCDNHADRTTVPGLTRRVNLGSGPYELELCEECWDTTSLAQLEKLCADWGRQIDTDPTATKQKLRCPLCNTPPLASPRNWRDHLDAKHPGSAKSLLDALAKVRGTPKVKEPPPPNGGAFFELPPEEQEQDLSCPECGRDDLKTRQARAVHRARAHGWRKGDQPA